jgi:hypothetical protein
MSAVHPNTGSTIARWGNTMSRRLAEGPSRWVAAMLAFAAFGFSCMALCAPGQAAAPTATDPALNFGPYNVSFLEGGIGLSRPLAPDAAPLAPGAPWAMTGWIKIARVQPGTVVVAALGDAADLAWRGLLLSNGRPALRCAAGADPVTAGVTLEPGHWYAIAATYDGTTARLFVDGRAAGSAAAATMRVPSQLQLAPTVAPNFARTATPDAAPPSVRDSTAVGMREAGTTPHFGGALALFTVTPAVLTAEAAQSLAAGRPDFSLITFNPVGVGWPWQARAWRGLQEPQDPWTLPHSHAAPPAPVAAPVPPDTDRLDADGASGWTLNHWRLAAAPGIAADGAQLSRPDYREQHWYAAVVPGTVLTTLIARGVYADPDYGLNNLSIPDSLSRQDYWYRTVFVAPAALRGRELTLTFNGINYAAEVWLNGSRVGSIKGAFIRGVFTVTGKLQPGRANAIAVRISPPPHPGIPHEESIAAGPGENGGAMAIDGPTFVAAEGWDWIPGIRDRNTGLWQNVELSAGGVLRLLDPKVTTQLPLPRRDNADVSIDVPVENRATAAVTATVSARFDAVHVSKTVTLAPGISTVRLDSREFPQLHLGQPRLWWPNGYGPANLYTLHLSVEVGGRRSDSSVLRFGVRQLTYELSLFDRAGRLRRVEVDPTAGSVRGERLVDVRHEAIKRTPQGWAESLTQAGELSPAVRPISSESLTPYLTIRVNGVPIAARGGSWGMDDSRKRSSRAHLEPFFRLHRDANLNIIRNWLGQNTEETFYDLADEYGLLVLNDFWESTQDFQVEPQDPALFLANARDVVSRYRNHPSIAVWFGRNEGVPQPILNEGLADIVATLDGTRYYTGSSNSVNLQGSGPYNYRPPEQYFTTLAQGFSVEVGTPSLSTLESLQASIPAADRWPLSDTIAYHDWHFGGNGDVATFMAALSEQAGAATSLEDFERKAQLMNYVTYRAIFEGFQAHLWTRNSGRLLWMTHPSWPSNAWQMYSSDYDTAAAYYAVKKACEPVHAQMDLPDYRLAVVNTTLLDRRDLKLRSRVLSLDNRVLAERIDPVSAPANAVTNLEPLDLGTALAGEGVVLVKLTLTDASGATLSDNVYWPGRDAAGLRRLTGLPAQPVALSARAGTADGKDGVVDVLLSNQGNAPVLNAKITVQDAHGSRVLPVYYSDNYISLLPGESRHIEVRCPAGGADCARVALRGWNIESRAIAVDIPRSH